MSKRPNDPNQFRQETTRKKSKGSKKGNSSKPRLPRFCDEKASVRYFNFSSLTATSKIVPCYYIEPSKIEELRLTSIMAIFGDLMPYMTCNEQICEPTLWEFYANMENIGGEITSRINSKDITINASRIRATFGDDLDSTAFNPYFASTWPDEKWCRENNFDLVDLSATYFKVKWHKNVKCKKEFKPMNLDATPRLVFELMWLLLTNSSGHSSEPTIAQVLLFFALMKGRKIDYARYLIAHLTFSHLKGKDIPCGNLIMRVLKHLKVKAPKAPTVATYLQCNEIPRDFFKNKKVVYDVLERDWRIVVPKNPSSKSNQGEGSSSNMGGDDFDARMERAVERAQAPLLAKIDDLERALNKSLVIQSTLIDEVDVLRKSHLMEMDDARYNRVVAYRQELENERIERMGESARSIRRDALRSHNEEEDESSSTPSPEN